MSYVKNYDVGITRLDDTYKHYVHELPLLSFGDARNTFALSLVFQSKLTSNPFYIANGYKLNIQKRIIFSEGYPQSYEDGNGALVKLNRFGNKYAFDDGSQRIIRLINGQYVLENPDYSTEIFNTSGNIMSAKDKYGNTILSYTYSSGKLVSVVYKNRKTVTFGYSSNALQYIQYASSTSTFKTTFAYSGNSLVVSHYSGVDYHFDYTVTEENSSYDDLVYVSKVLTVYSANKGAGFSNSCSYKNIATEDNYGVTIEKLHGNTEIDRSSYSIISYDADGNVKMIEVSSSNSGSTTIQFESGKPAYSYEYLSEMFVPRPDADGYYYYPGKVTFYNNDKAIGYQNYDDGIIMTCCNTSYGIEPNSYVLMHNLSGMMTVSGWLKPKTGANINECKISISGTDNIEKYSYWVTGLTEDNWTYFSVSFYMENDIVVHARTNETNAVVEARDFRVSAQEYSAEELKEYKDNLIKSAGVLIHTDSSGVDHPIAITDNVEFLNGATIINQDTYPITINDLMRFKTNQKIGTNTGEIYYNDGRGILTLSGTFYVKYCTSEGSEITVSLENLAIGKMHTSKGNEYVTKTNFYVEGGATKLKTQSMKNSSIIQSEIYDSKLDLIESTVRGVNTLYSRNSNGLLESQTIKSAGNSDITTSAVYDTNEFLVSTTDEFGLTTTYTTNDVWGVITTSAVSGGMTVTDTFDNDCSTSTSRKFSVGTNEIVNEFGYENGFVTSITNNSLNYTMGYNADFISSIKKNNSLIGEFETTRISSDFINEYDGDNETAYYPNSDNPEYTITQKYDDYGRLVEMTGLIKNIYDIAPINSNGSYTTRGINIGSAKLASREDFVTGNTIKYGYENNRISHIGEFNSSGTKVNEEVYTYDDQGKLTGDKYTYDNAGNYVQRNYTYVTSESSAAVGMVSNSSNKINGTEKAKIANSYDTLGRLTKKTYTLSGKAYTKSISYNKTRVNSILDSAGGLTGYGYDDIGRISEETDSNGNILKSYTYDSFGRIERENNKGLDKTFTYEYNNIGNVVSVKTYSYATGSLGSAISQQSFGYNTTYPDRLTSFGGTSISYNAMGCPTTVNGYTATWTRGKLSKLTKGSRITGTETYNYTYNSFGQRIGINYNYMAGTSSSSAIVMGMLTSYSHTFRYDQSGRLICESKTSQYYGEGSGTEQKVYLYDESGIIGMVYTSESGTATTYYFQRNLLGDVIGIYNTSGTKVGGYAYDAWGNCTITLDANGIASRNPIRYRGYYYDQGTKLYYLNARYYCPEWRRFISPAKAGSIHPSSIDGLNLYSYALNSPVSIKYDSSFASANSDDAGLGSASATRSSVSSSSLNSFGWLGSMLSGLSSAHGAVDKVSSYLVGSVDGLLSYAGIAKFNGFQSQLTKYSNWLLGIGIGLDLAVSAYNNYYNPNLTTGQKWASFFADVGYIGATSALAYGAGALVTKGFVALGTAAAGYALGATIGGVTIGFAGAIAIGAAVVVIGIVAGTILIAVVSDALDNWWEQKKEEWFS